MPCNHLGHGRIPILPIWKGIHLGNGSKTTSVHLQEAYGGNFSKDPEVSSQKLSIPTLQPVQYRKGMEIPLADAKAWKFH